MYARLCLAALGLAFLGSTGGLIVAADAAAAPSCPLLIACTPEAPPVEPPPEGGLGGDDDETQTPPSTTTTAPAPPAPAPQAQVETPSAAAATLLGLLNDERRSRGLPEFTTRADVNDIAMSWSRHLSTQGKLSHNDAYFTPETRRRIGARALGENVAMNPTMQAAHKSLMESPHHRDNILDRRFLVVGIGAEFKNGGWWVTENFLQPVHAPAAPTTRARPAVAVAPSSTTHNVTVPTAAPTAARPVAEATGVIVTAVAPMPQSRSATPQRPMAVNSSTDAEQRTPASIAGAAGIAASGAALLRARRRARASATVSA